MLVLGGVCVRKDDQTHWKTGDLKVDVADARHVGAPVEAALDNRFFDLANSHLCEGLALYLSTRTVVARTIARIFSVQHPARACARKDSSWGHEPFSYHTDLGVYLQ